MNRLEYLIIFVFLLGCSESTTTNDELTKAINERLKILDGHFLHQVLISNNKTINHNNLIQTLDSLYQTDQLSSVDEISNNYISTVIDYKLTDISNKNELLITELLLLDDLINRANRKKMNFRDIKPIVTIDREDDNKVYYNVLLHANDSSFHPAYSLTLPTGTFNILVDELGIGHFSMDKQYVNKIKTLKGQVSIPITMDERINLKFQYPESIKRNQE
jgi:hypothetical protein